MADPGLNSIRDLVVGKYDLKITVKISRLWNHIPVGSKDVTTVNMILLDEKVIFIFNSVSNLCAYFVELFICNIYCPYFQGSKIHASIFKKDIILRHRGTLIEGNCCTIQGFNEVENYG